MTDAIIRITTECNGAGIDIVHPYSAGGSLGLVFGNTKRLWPIFLARGDPSSPNPLDEYVVSAIERALAPYEHEVRYAHDPMPSYVPIQRIAEEAGLARRSRTHLSIHPDYGPWFALRAVAWLDQPAPDLPALRAAACEACEIRCQAALEVALVEGGWERWLAVRDACNVGRAWRYSEDQIAYHYTKDRKVLRWT